jgi:hypothetical protein
MDRNIRIGRQLKQVFEPYCLMLKDLNEKKEAAPIAIFLQKKKIEEEAK